MSEERKPCPKCGKRPYIVPLVKANENLDPWAQYDPASQVITKHFAQCVCGLKSDEKDTQAEAVAAWNDMCERYKSETRDQTAKADKGKAQISKVPPQIVFDIAEVREYGNRKYGDPDNWKTVEPERYIDAAGRHYWAMVRDPYGKDEESGIENYKHLACNLAFLCEMLKGGRTVTTEWAKTWYAPENTGPILQRIEPEEDSRISVYQNMWNTFKESCKAEKYGWKSIYEILKDMSRIEKLQRGVTDLAGYDDEDSDDEED